MAKDEIVRSADQPVVLPVVGRGHHREEVGRW
jgi:hypothetical protein